MSGKVESYRMNDPMKWEEFKAMPKDLQKDYIVLIRERFGVSDTTIAKMFGIPQATMSRHIIKLELGKGKHCESRVKDKEGFIKWMNGVREEKPEVKPIERPAEVKPIQVVLTNGNLSYTGAADDILATVAALLGKRHVRLNVSWEMEESNG